MARTTLLLVVIAIAGVMILWSAFLFWLSSASFFSGFKCAAKHACYQMPNFSTMTALRSGTPSETMIARITSPKR